jgi:hypothetical protein
MKPPSVKRKDEKKSQAIIPVQDQPSPPSSPIAHLRKPAFEDLHARISCLAYELYLQRGRRDGHALEDWLDAEREVLDSEIPG